ncbi:MAG: nucleotidyltransferase domain-containing protein [Nitrospirae bacterium]|nr:nucleotidyltransferase domain-containing protein [Nitrospirota bacterium]
MDMEGLIREVKKAVPSLIALYRFGSQAKGEARPESDVDLAILAADALPSSTLFALQQELAASLKRDVDLVDIRAASTVLRMQVLSTGECLYSADDLVREQFETVVYSAYARLNEERRAILEDIRARGRVYAG